MFSFSGRLGRVRFLIGAAIRVALFAATVFGFSFILYGVVKATNCASVSGACGAVALIASMALKPLFFALFVCSLVGIALRRSRDAGLPAAVGAIIPALVLADWNFGIYGGAHWSFAFASGVLGIRFPWFMIAALVAIVVLGILPPRERPNSSAADAPRRFPLPPVPGALLAVAVLLAMAAVAFAHNDRTMGIMTLLIGLVPFVLPTFALYSALLYGLWCVHKRRDIWAFSVLAASLLPFGIYAFAMLSNDISLKREADAIAAIKTERLDRIPNVLVFQSQSVDGYFHLLGVHGIAEIIADGPYISGMVSYTGQRTSSGARSLPKVEHLPLAYLQLRVERKSSFAGPRQAYAAGGGPLELRHVAPGRDDLIAVWYRTYNPAPVFPPVLTVMGWMRKPNTIMADTKAAIIKTFLDDSIAKAATPPRRAALN